MQDRPQLPDRDKGNDGANDPRPAAPDDRLEPDMRDAGDALEADAPEEALGPVDDTVRVELPAAPPSPAAGPPPARRVPLTPVDQGAGSPAHPRVHVDRDSSWFWPLVNLIGLVAVVLVNWLANWLPFNDVTTGEVANRNAVPFLPAGWTFTIWGLIYAMLLAFVIYGFLPAGRNNPRIQAVGPFFLVANIANISWLFLWHWEQFGASLIVMAILLATLTGIYAVVRVRGRSGVEPTVVQRLIVWTPFSVYLGWISLATLANLQVWMDNGGWDGGPFGLRAWAVIFLLAGVLIAAGVAFFFHDAAFTLVYVWAYLGIAQEQWSTTKLVSVTAILLVIVAAALTVMASMLAFDSRTVQGRARLPFRRRTSPSSGV